MNTSDRRQIAEQLGNHFSGPIIFYYVWWLLFQAHKRKLERIYFLARDGYLLREIALLFCREFNLNIDCRYLYVSRASLRMPVYHIIGEEAWNLLTLGGCQVTLRSLLDRARLTEKQCADVCKDCGLDAMDLDQLLNRHELAAWRDALKGSCLFHRLVTEKSKAAYGAAIGYMRQEGLMDGVPFALADSGWTGSMQRSLRQLLQSVGFEGRLTGFYFGMYVEPKAPEDGDYFTWYFNRRSGSFIKIPFCNNLLECILAAPHGMTSGYQLRDSKYIPVMLPAPQGAELEHIDGQISAVLGYAERRVKEIDFSAFPEKQARQETQRLIRRYMAHPSRKEAAYYGESLFCDDVTEAYRFPLADGAQVQALKGYSFPARVWRRIANKEQTVPELFWSYGTIAFLPHWKRWWYRLNVYLWEWLRYRLHR